MKVKISEEQLKRITNSLVNEDLSDKDNQLMYHLNRSDFFLEKVKDHIGEATSTMLFNDGKYTSAEKEYIESIKSSIENISIMIPKLIESVKNKDEIENKYSNLISNLYQNKSGN
jgi:6-pyruvoyl-tetrahydropterin synthase